MHQFPPTVVAHADWSTNPTKRWLATAIWKERAYEIGPPVNLIDPQGLLQRVSRQAAGGTAFVGFDFPIGVPEAYAQLAGIRRYPEFLGDLPEPKWRDFFCVAELPTDISLQRPFYPMRPGGTRQQHLLHGLGLSRQEQLLRRCELPYPGRQAASPLFWTMGAKQVGKAAIAGWRDILLPALRVSSATISLWPFDGRLRQLLDTKRCVVAETYPAEACLHLGFSQPGNGWSKRIQADRRSKGESIQRWAARRAIRLTPALVAQLNDGFGTAAEGEDAFDAVVGLCSMIEVTLGHRGDGAPETEAVQNIEGWILGQSGDQPQ